MSDTTLYGLCELAREVGLPESTTRYYRDVFAPFVPSVGMGRKRRYPPEAVATIRFIAESFAAGITRDEIYQRLSVEPENERTNAEVLPQSSRVFPQHENADRTMNSLLEGEREQRELMWQMVRELSRFGDAIERQHYILSELVEHVFHGADRQLPAAQDEAEVETVIEADVIADLETVEGETERTERSVSDDEVRRLREALETERGLVNKLRQSKLELERRAAEAEMELEHANEQEPSLLRRLFERDRSR